MANEAIATTADRKNARKSSLASRLPWRSSAVVLPAAIAVRLQQCSLAPR